MKLFVISALIAVAAAGRLEHLENSYIPPNGASSAPGQASKQYLAPKEELSASNLVSQFAGTQGFAQNSNGQQYDGEGYVYNKPQPAPQQYAIPSTIPQQYAIPSTIPQQHAIPSTIPQQYAIPSNIPQQYAIPSTIPQQYAIPSTNYGTPDGSIPTSNTNFQAQYNQEQVIAASNQYQASQSNSFENIPQQSFNEETGYHY